MKFLQFLFCAVLMPVGVWAQAPQKFNYQGVARNATGDPIPGTGIGLRLSITDGTNTLYSETFNATTTALGLFTVEVGGGTVQSGTFAGIDWLGGQKFLKVEMDAAGGISYVNMGTSQLLSVPYALVAEKVGNMALGDLSDVSGTTPVTNQVLQWNGTQWAPANISTGGGDNWGSQMVVSSAEFSGNGTAAAPLALAPQGATNGQVLRWNGSAWAPSTVTGDNWGTQAVSTGSAFSGNGTPGNPLALAQMGATAGQALKWNGLVWTPADDDGLLLPYEATVALSADVFKINNGGTGYSIVGINSSGTDAGGVLGLASSAISSTYTSGVFGRNNATGSGGLGVMGQHDGSGVGVYGTALGSNGTGVMGNVSGANANAVMGVSTGTSGIGVMGQGTVGISGFTNTNGGRAIWGTALNDSHAGYFEGKTLMRYNSTATAPNLLITETDNTDYARLRFDNTIAGKFWEINALNAATATAEKLNIWHHTAGAVMTVRGDGNVGLGVFNPVQRLDVAGSVQFTGALMPNGQPGNSGQVLVSAGGGVPPVWTSSTAALYSNTYLWDQYSTLTLGAGDQAMIFGPGGQYDLVFNTNGASKILINFSHGQVNNGSAGGGDSFVRLKVVLRDNSGNIINQAYVDERVANNRGGSVSYTHHCFLSTAGTYKINIVGVILGGDTDVTLPAPAGGVSTGQVNLQVIPQ